MSRLEDVEAAKGALRVLARIVKTTHNTLLQAIAHPTQQPTPEQQHHFSDTLDHIGDVREGFVLSQRASPLTSRAEVKWLVQHVLLDWQWVEAMGLSLTPGNEIELVGNQLIAYQHALVALGMLPRLPAQAVTFPQPRPTYADVPVPAMPSQLLERIEEIERVLYRAGLVPADELAFEPLRRTYAFFEASLWLVDHYLPPMLSD
jgi:hypothetical protein